MLKTVWLTERSDMTSGCAMLLGGFDGLHAGHKKLLARAKTFGLPVGVMTISGAKEGESLFTLEEREDIFRRNGADFVFELPFPEIKELSPSAFLDLLQKEFSPKAFVCGDDFRFGYRAQGTPETLKCDGQVCVEVHEKVRFNGENISSTSVKKMLAKGNVTEAETLLGEPFFLIGEVIADRKVGRTIGFPTANVVYPKGKYPLKKGVYETLTEADGKNYRGITNYGARPTFDNDRILTETYLDGFTGDLYGKKIKVRFVRFLREIQKFENADELKTQLTKDIRRVREYDKIRTER